MRVEIISVSRQDACYPRREIWIGMKGKFKSERQYKYKWQSGEFIPDNPIDEYTEEMYFYKVKVKEIK